MDRRAFVRILGGGSIAAALPLGGCTGTMPPAAIAAWQPPAAGQDIRRWILAHAILAPHSHNLQSWAVDLGTPGEVLLYCDLGRLLPETDPYGRQIMMSHGTFLELFALAAAERGLRADIVLFPEGEFAAEKIDGRPVAKIRLIADAAVRPDPLFGQIFQRRTNRNRYDLARPIPQAAWDAMRPAAAPYNVAFGHADADDAPTLARHRDIAAEAWRIELTTPRTILESYRVLRVGAAEIAKHRDGISLLDPLPVWMNRLGMFDRTKAPAPGDMAVTRQIKDFGEKLASTPAFLWMVTSGNGRRTQIEAGRAYALVQLAATAQGVAMQPLQQALQEYPEQAGPYRAIHELVKASTPAQTVQMWARVGFAPPVGPAPRRGVDAHILAPGSAPKAAG